MTIILQKSNNSWQAMFNGSDVMPNNVWLPLPFTMVAQKDMVIADMRKRFPNVTCFRIKPNAQ